LRLDQKTCVYTVAPAQSAGFTGPNPAVVEKFEQSKITEASFDREHLEYLLFTQNPFSQHILHRVRIDNTPNISRENANLLTAKRQQRSHRTHLPIDRSIRSRLAFRPSCDRRIKILQALKGDLVERPVMDEGQKFFDIGFVRPSGVGTLEFVEPKLNQASIELRLSNCTYFLIFGDG